jgi:hypothetical protein
MYLNRQQILDVEDIKTEEVEVPEWGGTLVVKMMTGAERDRFEASIYGPSGKAKIDNIRAKLVAQTVIDPETGEKMFSPADIDALGNKSAAALDRVFTASKKLSKITEDDVEELVKN